MAATCAVIAREIDERLTGLPGARRALEVRVSWSAVPTSEGRACWCARRLQRHRDGAAGNDARHLEDSIWLDGIELHLPTPPACARWTIPLSGSASRARRRRARATSRFSWTGR
jgi:hypothetical protein